MPYYTRAFCRTDRLPRLDELAVALRARGIEAEIIAEDEGPLDAPVWAYCELRYAPDRHPIPVHVSYAFGPKAELPPEAGWLASELDARRYSPMAWWIKRTLQASPTVVRSQLLGGDIDDRGYDANWAFLSALVNQCGGVLHAEQEGFYVRNFMVLKSDG